MTEALEELLNTTGDKTLSMAELVASLSQALDLTEGEPMGHSIRSCAIGMALAQALHLSRTEQKELYYALLLKDAGCSANSHQISTWFGTDDRHAKHALKTVNWSRMTEAVRYAIHQAKPGAQWRERLTQIVQLSRRGPKNASRQLVAMRCTRGADVIRSLGWVELAPAAVLNLDEHWDGSGQPQGLRGEAIPLLGRILALAQTAEIFWGRYGKEAARTVVRQRRGTWFDPALSDLFLQLSAHSNFWEKIVQWATPNDIAALDPAPSDIALSSLDPLLHIARVFGEIVDTKSPWTVRHSIRTAHYAQTLAEGMGWSVRRQQEVLLAGFFHDLGKLGVSNLVLDKPGPLDKAERQAIEQHPDFTYRILQPIAALRPLAAVAATHHERLDGSGYHQQLQGEGIPVAGQVIAVADVYDALAHARPYRRQLTTDEVLDIMRKEAGNHLSTSVFDVLQTAVRSGAGYFAEGSEALPEE
ncbi:MAG: HD domain-containing protein [Firmicutes bacterium]|nr:HD domain-containing protein [Bacillota bacterium]